MKIKFEEFKKIVDFVSYESEYELRYGQVLMNVLYEIWPEKYQEITGTDLDCFYESEQNESLKLLKKLEEEW